MKIKYILPDKMLEDKLEHGMVCPRHPLQQLLDLKQPHSTVRHHCHLYKLAMEIIIMLITLHNYWAILMTMFTFVN